MTLKDFEKLTDKEKGIKVSRAMAWLCVYELFHPELAYHDDAIENIETIKIILGKYKG